MKKIVFKHKKFSVQLEDVTLPDGYKTQFATITKKHGTAIIAFLNKNTIILNREYRPAVKKWMYELPGGKIEESETPKQNAFKELVEETGYAAKKMELLTKVYPAPYMSNDLQYVFIATDLVKVEKKLEKGEVIKNHEIKLKDVIEMIYDGRITDAVTIATILMVSDKK